MINALSLVSRNGGMMPNTYLPSHSGKLLQNTSQVKNVHRKGRSRFVDFIIQGIEEYREKVSQHLV
jgi:hypothetical protein